MQDVADVIKILLMFREDLQRPLGKLDLIEISALVAHPNIPTNFSNR